MYGWGYVDRRRLRPWLSAAQEARGNSKRYTAALPQILLYACMASVRQILQLHRAFAAPGCDTTQARKVLVCHPSTLQDLDRTATRQANWAAAVA